MNREYYINLYERSKNNLIEVIVCLLLGMFLVCFMRYCVFDEFVESTLVLLIFPYGLKKTWSSVLVLRRGPAEAVILWIMYLTIKLVIAILYGVIGIPLVLFVSLCDMSRAKKALMMN